ncbi:A24 family peptidase [Sphingomonas colocasiae]|uniref:A24 family peptidase n=1 Tax=Sphingomonas colocasiae TaxID=1848973 RepID=UPI0031BA2047
MAALGCLLLVAVFTDLKGRTIEHWTVAAIALLAPFYWWTANYALWPDVAIQIGIAIGVFALFAGVYAIGMMGGGDVKLLAALALWLPIVPLFNMLFIMAIAGGVITLIALIFHKIRKLNGQIEVPYGVAIAIGGLWVMSEHYFNQFA